VDRICKDDDELVMTVSHCIIMYEMMNNECERPFQNVSEKQSPSLTKSL